MGKESIWKLIQASADFEYFQRAQLEPVELSTGGFQSR
jgi:hypothetical protein